MSKSEVLISFTKTIGTHFVNFVSSKYLWNIILIFLALSFVTHVALCAIFGLSIGFVNPFFMQIYNIRLKTKKYQLHIRSARFQFSPSSWAKLVLVFEDVHLNILETAESDETLQANKKANNMKPTKAKEKFHDSLNKLNEKPLCIFSESFLLRNLLKMYLLYFRFVGIRLYDFSVSLNNKKLIINTDSIIQKVSMKRSKDSFHIKLSTRVIQVSLNDIEVFDTLTFDISGTLDFKTGSLSKMKLGYEMRDLTLPIFSLINIFTAASSQSKSTSKVVKDEDYYITSFYKRLCFMCYFVKLVEEVSVSLHGISISEIPLANKDVTRCGNYQPLVFFEFKVNSFVLNVQRMYFDSPGFGLSYKYEDKPYHTVYNFTGVQILMKNTKKNTLKEVVSIPVMNITGSSNLAFQTLEAAEDDKPASSNAIFVGHLSEPVLDLSTDDITTAVLSAFEYIKHQHFLKSSSNYESKVSSPGTSKWSCLSRFSNLWPTLDLKLGVENPVIMMKSSFDDRFYRILFMKLSLISVSFESFRTEDNRYVTKQGVDLTSFKVKYRNNFSGLENNLLHIENIAFRQELGVLPNVKLDAFLNFESPTIEASNINTLHGINHMFNELKGKIQTVVDNFKEHVHEFDCYCASESHSSHRSTSSFSMNNIVNEKLPAWLNKIKLSTRNFNATVGSRSLLLSKDVMKLIEVQSKNDLVNDQLRKVELSISDFDLRLITNKIDDDNDSSSSSSSLEDDDRGLEDLEFDQLQNLGMWKLKLNVRGCVGKIHSERKSHKDKLKSKVFLKIPDTDITCNPSIETENLIFNWNTPRVEMFYSVISHFIIISSLHLMRNTIFEFLLNSKHIPTKSKPPKKSSKSLEQILALIQFNLNIDFFDLILVLPDALKVRLELTRLDILGFHSNSVLINSHYTRLCAESPSTPGHWTRLLTAVDGSTSVDLEAILTKSPETWANLSNNTCHITIPNQFVIYKIFENISVAFKTLKQLHHSLKTNSNDIVINPSVKGASKIPKLNLKSDRVLFSMEDDPFESEINMILQIGLLEQKMRAEKTRIIEQRLLEEIQAVKLKNRSQRSKASSEIPRRETENLAHALNSIKIKFPLHHSATTSTIHEGETTSEIQQENLYLSELEKKAEERLYKLKEGFSKSWISRVRNYRQKIEDEFRDNFNYLWGNFDIKQMPVGFDRKVLDFVKTPHLFNMILEGVDLTIDEPSCGIEHVPDFIYNVGKGVPKETKYSILIPVNLDLKLSSLRCHLRDYPLPLIYMPETTKSQPYSLPAIHVKGDLVIGEAIIRSQREVREVYVPLVPGCEEIDRDTRYSLEVPKTLTSIKFFTSLSWELNSEKNTKVTWGNSYQPCIQHIMLNLDNFTKPPVDPSEKVGFWDKIRDLFHARMRFSWKHNGQLDIQFKGSKDPYAICGKDAGFVLGFKDDVVLSINEKDDPKDFLVVNSSKILFAVPNHFASSLLVWSRAAENAVYLTDPMTNFQKSAFGYHLADTDRVNTESIEALNSRGIEKSVITLAGGVQFKVAIAFERKALDGTRTSKSTPHYDVLLSNPKYINANEDYDAYRGFRSDYIHLGLSLLSTQSDAYNTIQLTPGAFTNFFSWWAMFSNSLSIRHGPLFGPEKPTKKFGRHLYTMKYEAILEPLFIANIYHDSDAVTNNFEKLECIGVKGRASKLILDLHQRKEVTYDHNPKLGVTKRTMKTKFNIGKIEIQNLDMRTIHAAFNIDRDLLTRVESQPSRKKTKRYLFEVFDGDLSWFDLSDYSEIGAPILAQYRGKISAYPLMYTPKFIYEKQNNNGDKGQIDFDTSERIVPFGNEEFHDCNMKHGITPNETQVIYFTKRIEELTDKLNENLRLIGDFKPNSGVEAKKKTDQLKVDNEQLKHGIQFVAELLLLYKGEKVSGSSHKSSYDLIDEVDDGDSFGNKFTIHNMLLKWNNHNRDIVYHFIHQFEVHGAETKFLQHKALSQIDEVIESQKRLSAEDGLTHPITRASTYETKRSAKEDNDFESVADTRVSERVKNFKDELREISVNFSYITHDKYLVKLISPQIQLQSEEDKKACVLVVAPNIELNVIAFDANSTEEEFNENVFEQRFGTILTNSSIFLFHESEILNTGKLFFSTSSYGSNSSWPPWLGLELCYDGSLISDHVLSQKASVVVRYDKLVSGSFLTGDEQNINKLSCDLSRAVFTCDAKQYFSLYNIIMKLLMYNDPRTVRTKERQSKMLLRLDLNDLSSVKTRIVHLQESIKHAGYIIENFASRRGILDEVDLDDMNLVANARHEANTELHTLMHVSLLGNTKSREEVDDFQHWLIRADDIKLHMLDDDRKPFLDVILFDSHFMRVERSDRSDKNVISIQNLEVINLDKKSHLPVVFSSFKDKKKAKKKIYREADEPPLIHILWHMDNPVGGIRVMKKFDVSLQPVQISLEETTGEKIIKYAFPNESPLLSTSSFDDDDEDDISERASLKRQKSISSKINGKNSIDLEKRDSNTNGNGTPKPFNALRSIKFQSNGNDQGSINSTDSDRKSNRSLRKSIFSSKEEGSIDGVLSRSTNVDDDEDEDDGVEEMVKRASSYLSFVSFKFNTVDACVTFRGTKARRLINVSNFVFTVPEISFVNKTYTLLDLTMHLKKAVIKALLSHTGSIIGNKLTLRSNDKLEGGQAKNISGYASSRINTFRN